MLYPIDGLLLRLSHTPVASHPLSVALQEAQDQGMPGWVYPIIFVLVVVIVWWLISRQAGKKETPPAQHEPEAMESPAEEPNLPQPARMEVAERVAAPPAAVGELLPDDLTLIEGIGPKISGLLREAGIKTFTQLAQADLGRLRQILDQAGLRISDPGTWAEQARLAAAKDMEGLRTLQDSLKGGRRVG